MSSLTPGTRLGPYEITASIGVGGMGEVYRARDTRLDRTVAIKILPEALARDPQFRERFGREARAISQLTHPHICTLYDVGEARLPGPSDQSPATSHEPIRFLVMEYLEGETLADRLKKGALPLDQSLRIAIQIADALSTAHKRGIVHRDLKPGNMMLTKAGAKLLDFGLAKAGLPTAAAGLSMLPTTPMNLTAKGTILGTFEYMSPEQLEGRDADTRTDIFAFGAVLYEMVTGTRAFEAKSQASLIAAILEHQPPLIALVQPKAPAALDHVVSTCLAKDPDDRWQTAGDLKRELDWIVGSAPRVGVEATTSPPRATRRWSRTTVLVSAAVVLAAAAFGAYLFQRKAGSAGSLITLGRTTQITFDPGLELDPALSPDGKLLAYAAGPSGQTQIYVRQLGAVRSILLTQGLNGYHRWPQWSPDGSRIAFFSGSPQTDVRTISIVPSLGGVSKRLVKENGGDLCCPAWSPDGTRIAYASANAVYVRSLDGERAAKIADHPQVTHSLAWSPDGARLAYAVENSAYVFRVPNLGNIAPSAIWVVSAAGGRSVQVTDRVHLNMCPAWMRDSKGLLFVSNRGGRRDVYEVALRDSGEPAGNPTPLTTGLNALTISLSNDGTKLAYSVFDQDSNIWSIPIPDHPPVSMSSASQVTTGSQVIEGLGVSRDGSWLAFDSNRNGNQDIYRIPLAGGEMEQLTTNPGDDFMPSWSPDGKEIVFYSFRNGNRDLFLMSADGSAERQLTSEPGHELYPDFSPDGRQVVFWSIQTGKDALALLTRTANGGWEAPKDLATPGGWPRWSPDGRLIAYGVAGSLRVVSPQGSVPRVLVESKDLAVVTGHEWDLVPGQPDRVLQDVRRRPGLEYLGPADSRRNTNPAGEIRRSCPVVSSGVGNRRAAVLLHNRAFRERHLRDGRPEDAITRSLSWT